ncbi:hypothetical protein BHK98_00945 [Hornefia porci]|uniref:LicD/FKTN/FKRP nucleotidyltransferase domain-containing protein n=1 Tax=Hornefia porci TaxID=2652292 RepID=A0A1Q9JF62_9FIRM|nr:LicD family protein [Hornefia porci]OLR54777.1 hypothetical protein BHK98_00945 [Hornefia porci]
MDGNYMNEIQSVILEIFKCVDGICVRNNIPYFAIGGTCIGAVRHQGFIPWDDDLDIAVPVEYFDAFLEAARRELPEYYSLRTGEETEHYSIVFPKIMDERTTFIEDVEREYPDSYKGVFVDVMPLSGVPENRLMRGLFYKRVNFVRVMNVIRRFPVSYHDRVWKKILGAFMVPFKKIIPFDFYERKWYKILKKRPLSGSEITGFLWEWAGECYTFKSRCFIEAATMKFEDTEIRCPALWDEYLQKYFGDYMELPPESNRKRVHKGVIDLTRPYREYQKLYEINGKAEFERDDG